jgi:hypothetical protein
MLYQPTTTVSVSMSGWIYSCNTLLSSQGKGSLTKPTIVLQPRRMPVSGIIRNLPLALSTSAGLVSCPGTWPRSMYTDPYSMCPEGAGRGNSRK